MKKMITWLLVCAILVVAAYHGGFLKSDEQKIEDRMNDFLKSYNAGDMNGVLDSFDAKTRNTYKAAMNVGNSLIGLTGFGIDMSDMFSLGIALSEGDALQFDDMQITIVSDTKATVRVTFRYQNIQESYTQKAKFTLVKEDNDWYING